LNSRIQVLRGIAVLGVVLMHLKLFSLPGGFLGVDIFFALSGFLLSRNLIREYEAHIVLGEKKEYFSLINFYSRRFFRIVPAAFFVASCTLLTIFFIASQEVLRRSVVDYVLALLFSINFRLIQQQTDYFASTDLVSYFQHYWSLASEEQFYILLPIALLWALKLHGLKFRGIHLSWQARINCLVATLTITSLISSLLLQQINPVMNYFLFTSRVWEFGIGIFFAVNQTLFVAILKRFVNIIRVITYLLIVSCFVFLTPESPKLIFVSVVLILSVSSCLTVSDIDSSSLSFTRVFMPFKRMLTRTGDVSFSLYLWHWPVILISGLLFPGFEGSVVWHLFQLVLIYVLSAFTYKYIEQRFRGKKLNRKTKAAFTRFLRNFRHDIVSSSGLRKVSVMLILLSLVLNFGYLHKTSSDYWDDVSAQVQMIAPESMDSNLSADSDQQNLDYNSYVKEMVVKALAKSSVTQAEADLVSGLIEERNNLWRNSCQIPMSVKFAACADQNASAPRKIAFLGDSYVMPFVTLIPQILGRTWSGQNLYFGQCTFASVTPFVNGVPFDKCAEHRKNVLAFLKTDPPDAVFIAENWNTPVLGVEDGDENKRLNLLADGLRTSFKSISPDTRVFYFGTPPDADSLPSCISRAGTIKAQCFSTPISNGRARGIQSQIVKETGGVYIDPVPLLCANLSCPPIVDGVPVTYDGSHLNLQYLIKIKEYFKPFFEGL
jgi:peptidoglycan/LPS O-acetylase OafA/YrhL